MKTHIDLLGLAVEVEVAAEPAAEHVRNLLRGLPAAKGRSAARTVRVTAPSLDPEGHALFDGQDLVAAGMSAPVAIRALLWHLNRLALLTGRHTVLHAGAAATEGRTVVLPAPMESGKSTLVAALVREGFEYLSDELAPLTVEGGVRLWPYRCPLGLDPGSFGLFPELRPSVASELHDEGHWFIPVDDAGRGKDDDASADVKSMSPLRHATLINSQRAPGCIPTSPTHLQRCPSPRPPNRCDRNGSFGDTSRSGNPGPGSPPLRPVAITHQGEVAAVDAGYALVVLAMPVLNRRRVRTLGILGERTIRPVCCDTVWPSVRST